MSGMNGSFCAFALILSSDFFCMLSEEKVLREVDPFEFILKNFNYSLYN